LFRPSELHPFLQSLGAKAKKSLSQNFLIDGNILRKIVEVGSVSATDTIIEIGPGPGALTQALLQTGATVYAIEKDATFASALHRLQTEDKRLHVFNEDALTFPLESILNENKKAKVIANLPYQITTPLIAKFLPLYRYVSSLTVMVQKEVADRMTASVNTSEYSSLTLFLQCYAACRTCFTVEPTCFYPRPSVRSAVVQLTLKAPVTEDPAFFHLMRTAFQHRRKMLRASLKSLYPRIDQTPYAKMRPEQLSLDQFLELFRSLSN
jgi:16S rRNA (adenine1518-N6/adenine1519-N6)-dimethyltransferase